MTTPVSRWQECAACGERLDERAVATDCPRCGGLLDVRYDPPAERGTALRRRFEGRFGLPGPIRSSGVWRYRELILDVPDAEIVTFPEGNTPLLSHPDVSAWSGCEDLSMKHEGMNPTGSFKDRGMTVGVTQARRIGARAVACASTGNTSASLASYAARAGIPALVFVPAGRVALGKLTQTLAYGARTLVVRGDFDTCLALARQAVHRLGIYLLNSVNPFRVEGQKTIVFEMLQQRGWEAPDWIALPAGNLGNTAAFGKALGEAFDMGLIDRMPRLLAVQAAGAAPFYMSYRVAFSEQHRVSAETVATAIRIGDPASYARGVSAMRRTSGAVVAVPDEEILEAKAVIDAAGIGCEPASAASVAGVRSALKEGLIAPGASVVSVLTGHVLKDPGTLLWYHQDAPEPPSRRNAPIEVEPDLASVSAVLETLVR